MCQQFDNSFEQILEDCKTVNPYGVAAKYPDEPYLDEGYVKIINNEAQKIYDFCKAKCFPEK
jgi:hypothetical protein